MRVLVVTPYYAPAYVFGGPIAIAETVVAGLLEAGHEVTVATTDALDRERRVPPGTPATPPGVQVIRFPNVVHAIAARAMAWTPRGWLRWARANVRGFDVVHLHDFYSVLAIGAARAAEAADVPYVLQPHGSVPPTPERGKAAVKRAALFLWGRRTLRGAAAILHASADERQEMIAAGAPTERLVRMPLPVELAPGPAPQRAAEPTVAFLGRLDPIKRIDVLIDAFARVCGQLPGASLEIAGPGDSSDLRKRAEASGVGRGVRFLGPVYGADKYALLGRAHAFCLLSRSEGLPVVAIEAMSAGTPVVVSRECHLSDVHERGGLVVTASADAAAGALLRILRDPEVRERLGRGARELAAPFARERVIPQMVGLFEGLSAAREQDRAAVWRA